MDKVIKEGTLRLLITESTCDVILSCRDHRLMAHKLVLSIASPVFGKLLRKNSIDSTSVIILPDINGSTMSTILDYIYTGTTVVYSHALDEFLSVAKFLQIVIDKTNIQNILPNLEYVKKYDDSQDPMDCSSTNTRVDTVGITKNQNDLKNQNEENLEVASENKLKNNNILDVSKRLSVSEQKYSQTKPQKRLPDLLPIEVGTFKKDPQKKMCNIVVPSPWCPRNERSFLGDPRIVSMGSPDRENQKSCLEDTNNNFQIIHNKEAPRQNPKKLDTIIRHLYLSNPEVRKEKASETNENCLEELHPKKYNKIKENCPLRVPAFRTTSENAFEKNTPEKPDLPKFTDFPFSRHLTDLLPFGSKYLGNTTTQNHLNQINKYKISNRPFRQFNLPKDQYNSNECVPYPMCKDRTLNNFIAKNYSLPKDSLPIDRVQNLSFPKVSASFAPPSPSNLPVSEPPSPTGSPTSRTSIGTLVYNEKDCSEIIPNSNDSSNSMHDVVNDNNSNDNLISSDSSNEEEKTEERESVKKKSFKCEECGKCFSQLRNYKYHRSVHEGTKEYSAKCPECGKTFNDRGYLSSHMKIHRDRKEYACPNCPKRFNQRVAYNMHLRIHTGVKPHECPTCGKSFSRKMLLKQHQRVHTGERPYSCPECGKTFADRSNMSLHARLHTGVKPYACTMCPKSFTKKHHLKTHMNFHTGLKPYNCENCGLAFSQSSNMRTHYKKCILKEKHGTTAKTESLSSADNNSS